MSRGRSSQKTVLKTVKTKGKESSVQSIGESCTIGTINKLKESNKEGFFAIITQEGCAPCLPVKDALKEAVKGKLPIIEIPARQANCEGLIKKLDVTQTPTILYLKEGSRMKRIAEGGETFDQVKDRVADILQSVSKK